MADLSAGRGRPRGGLLRLTGHQGKLTIVVCWPGCAGPSLTVSLGAVGGGRSVGGSDREHRDFVAGLTSGERLLISLRDELYEKSWDKMTQDLKDRLEKRPYIFKLSSRIESDMAAIERMRNYEGEHGVDLRAYLDNSVEDSASDEREA